MTAAEFRDTLDAMGLGQRELARALGVHRNAVYHWSSGRRPVPALVASWLALLRRNLELQRQVDELGAPEVRRWVEAG